METRVIVRARTSQEGVQCAEYHYIQREPYLLFAAYWNRLFSTKMHFHYGQNNSGIENVRDILAVLFDSVCV